MSAKILILLPGYNVARHLDELIPNIRREVPEAEICLVDDGSSDGTAEKAESHGITVLRHAQNAGKGQALKTGFAYAIERGHDAVLTMDSDNQHLPSEIPLFVQAFARGAHVVVGSRMHANDNMPWLRKRTNEFTSAVVGRLARQRISDSQSGYRLISTEVLRRIQLESDRYDLESEILIKAGCLGYRIESVPISSVYGDEASSINKVADTMRFLRLVWRSGRWRRHPEAPSGEGVS